MGVFLLRILGIDPGIERTGWGVVETTGRDFVPVDYGCIVTSKSQDLPMRILAVYRGVTGLIDRVKPDVLAIESIFFAKNAKSAIDVGHSRGVCLLAAAAHNLPVEEVTPLQVKSTIVGYGNATKEQVSAMVSSLLHLSRPPRPDDTADALGIAVTAGIKRSFGARLVRDGAPERTSR
ncbi:MAG: crossover junction endodeoxyribonuclease RuvC [Bacillota bacterium]|jgi:crossover junction endodeoxyribonuclease RuvC